MAKTMNCQKKKKNKKKVKIKTTQKNKTPTLKALKNPFPKLL